MNERIKQLTAQARNYAFDQKHHYERVHNTEQCMEDFRDVYNTKFAELIVQECVDMFPDDLNSMSDYTGKACRYMIKEHFGLTKTVVAE